MQNWIPMLALSALLVGCQGASQDESASGQEEPSAVSHQEEPSAVHQEPSAAHQESSAVHQESSTVSSESSAVAQQSSTAEAEFVRCTGDRPEACAQIYKPVCAHQSGDACAGENCPRRKTYGNACSACSDPQVRGYTQGACEQ